LRGPLLPSGSDLGRRLHDYGPGLVAAVAFATIVAVVAGLVLASASAMSHDIWVGVVKGEHATQEEEVRAARISSIIVGIVAIVIGILAKGQNVAHLVALAFAVILGGSTRLKVALQLDQSLAGVIQGMLVLLVLLTNGLRTRLSTHTEQPEPTAPALPAADSAPPTLRPAADGSGGKSAS